MRGNKKLVFVLLLCVVAYSEGCGRSGRRRACPPRDNTKPVVFCPGNIKTIADPVQTNAFVTWPEPVKAKDDRDGDLTATRTGPAPGTRFSRGDPTTITYFARDKSNNEGTCNFDITVKFVTCPTPKTVNNGYYQFFPANDFRYGGTVTYGCYKGYKPNGVTQLICREKDEVGYWSQDKPPTCEKIKCSNLNQSPITNGHITCTDSNYFQSKCTYSCKEGYRIRQGQSAIRVCSYRGFWLGFKPTCDDIQAPKFVSCPNSRIFYTARNKNQATPSWHKPTATDNSGESITAKLAPGGFEPGEWASVGTHKIVYNAEDSAKNQAKPCIFYVIVRRSTCHTIYPTPNLEVTCPTGYGFGEKCTFECDAGNALIGMKETTCEMNLNSKATYWDWGMRMPRCEGRKCEPLNPPKNGALACDTWLYGEYCKMLCESTFDVPRTAAVNGKRMLVCGHTGQWNRQKVPDCSKTRRAGSYYLGSETHYFIGDCCGSSTQEEIKQKFIEILSSSAYKAACNRYSLECNVQNVEVICGSPSQCASGRKKRSMTMTIKGTLTVTPEVNSSVTYENATNALNDMTSAIENATANSTLPDSTFNGFTAGAAKIQCEQGLKPSYNSYSCVPCETGYSVNNQDECEPCPIGHFQDGSGNYECTKCPGDKTTSQTGAKSINECIDLCQEGSFSTYGTEPCTPCPLGSYTNAKGSNSCIPCSYGKTTNLEGSTSINDCKSCKFLIVPSENTSYTMSSNISSGVVSSLTLSGKIYMPDDADNIGSVITISDSNGNEIMGVAIGDQLDIYIKGCRYSFNASLQRDNWNSLVITVDSSSVRFYLNGQLVSHTTQCSSGSFQISSDELISTVMSSEGSNSSYSLTDFNIWHNELLDYSSINNTVSTCYGTFGNTITWGSFVTQFPEACTVPADCDVSDNCLNNPCGNSSVGTCVDKENDYSCLCKDGYTGRNCETNIDDCAQHNCDNNATCIDGVNSYSCNCTLGFRGEYCEIEIVNGGWSEWSDWSSCSESCNNGSKSRQRTCDQPLPDADGEPCKGMSHEVSDCIIETCRSCRNLISPVNGYINCTYYDSIDMTNCTVECDLGYAFAVVPKEVYNCGYLTNYTWSNDDDSFEFPACTKMESAKEVSAKHSVVYENKLHCTSESRQQLSNVITTNVANLPCVINRQCEVSSINISCPTNGVTSMSFVLLLSMTGLSSNHPLIGDSVTALRTPAEALYSAAVTIYNQIAAGNYTVITSFGNHFVSSQDAEPQIRCNTPGYTWVDYFCIPCQYGYYEENSICHLCPLGKYNPHHGRAECMPCPTGFTTEKTGSKSADDCSVPQDQETSVNNSTGLNTDDAASAVPLIAGLSVTAVLMCLAFIVAASLLMKQCKGSRTDSAEASEQLQGKDRKLCYEMSHEVNYKNMGNNLPPPNTSLPFNPSEKKRTYYDGLMRENTSVLGRPKSGQIISVTPSTEKSSKSSDILAQRPQSSKSVSISINSAYDDKSDNFDYKGVTPLGCT